MSLIVALHCPSREMTGEQAAEFLRKLRVEQRDPVIVNVMNNGAMENGIALTGIKTVHVFANTPDSKGKNQAFLKAIDCLLTYHSLVQDQPLVLVDPEFEVSAGYLIRAARRAQIPVRIEKVFEREFTKRAKDNAAAGFEAYMDENTQRARRDYAAAGYPTLHCTCVPCRHARDLGLPDRDPNPQVQT